MTAVAAMQLVEQNVLELDVRLLEYWTDAPEVIRRMTLLDLLSHQSGQPQC